MDVKAKGFTLLEMLVVLAIIGILSAISVPSYGGYIARAKVSTAQSDLVLLSLRYENHYQRVLSYPPNAQSNTAALESIMKGWKHASEDADFVFSSDNASNTTYTLKATGQKGKFSGCVVTLTHDGDKSIASCSSIASDLKWL